jgi:site-specific recombinase XerD
MPVSPLAKTRPAATGDFWGMAKSFHRSLEAANHSDKTIRIYDYSVAAFGDFLAAKGMPTDLTNVTREHVEEFIIDLQKRAAPGTVETRYRGLRQFFKWALEEGEIKRSPMERIKRPAVPEPETPFLNEDQIKKLFAACKGEGFEERRDYAIIRLLLETGMRRSELANLRYAEDEDSDLDLDHRLAYVMGKGRRPRAVSFGPKAAQALDRYLRVRSRHKYAHSPYLWIGKRGPLGDGAIDLMLRRRANEAGLKVHAHMFRHGFAHAFLAAGGQEGDLMMLGGWKSSDMIHNRYGKIAAAERAQQAYKRLDLWDRL